MKILILKANWFFEQVISFKLNKNIFLKTKNQNTLKKEDRK
jgi:hypothetical protein